jgi:adenine-specific DNA methylase
MDYIGSKEKLNPWIFQRIARRFPDGLDGRLFLDACCGSASTSRYAARLGYRVLALDLLAFPVALANGSICDCPETIAAACDELRKLRELRPADGLFRQEYSPTAKAVPGGRPFFTEMNAGLLDACRQHVGRLTDNKLRDILLY